MSVSVLLSNLIGLFILIGAGYFVARRGIMPASTVGPLTSLLLRVTLPCTVLTSLMRPMDAGFFRDAAAILVIGMVVFPGLAILFRLLSRPFRVKKGDQGMWTVCCTFCNNGFMGYPVVSSLFGDDGLILAVIYGIAFNIFFYTMGARLILSDGDSGTENIHVSLRQSLLTAINGASLLGLLFCVFQVSLPDAVMMPVSYLGNLTTPLSMMVSGMKLAQCRVSDVIHDRDAVTSTLGRLVIAPLLLFPLLSVIPGVNPLVKNVVLITMAMPAPAASVILGEQYHGNTDLAARSVFLTSLACMATLPAAALLLL